MGRGPAVWNKQAEMGWIWYILGPYLKGRRAVKALIGRGYRDSRECAMKSRGLVNGVGREGKEATVTARCSQDHRSI